MKVHTIPVYYKDLGVADNYREVVYWGLNYSSNYLKIQ
jgi:hypothetical protein